MPPDARGAPHILILVYSLARGGAERMTVELARAWTDRGCRVTVLTLAPADQDFFHLDPRVERLRLSPTEPGNGVVERAVAGLRRLFELRRVLARARPEVAVGMMSSAAILLAMASVGLRVKTFGSERIHPPAMHLGTAKELVRRLTYGLLDGVICQTQRSADWIARNTWARAVHVVPNHVVYPLPRHDPAVAPETIVPEGRKLMLAVGRLEPQKQFDKLILAFSQAVRDAIDWELVILGDGSEREALKSQVCDLGLERRVRMPGGVGNMGDWYGRADIFVMTSRFEGFPNALLEAMAHGVPPVAFDCDTGPSEMIGHRSNGLLFPLDDMRGLVDGLKTLMQDDQLRTGMADQARLLRGQFSGQRVTALWFKAFGLSGPMEDDVNLAP